MNQNISRSAIQSLLFILVGIFTGPEVLAQTFSDLNIGNSSYTIETGNKEEYQNVFLNNNKSVLTVNGTLIVHGNLDMVGNQSQFIMGPDAIVIIYGDFKSSNSVSITAKSYLIVYGSFINNTPSNTADLHVEGGNIYIFGTVDNWGTEFTTCEEYTGDTGEIATEECDYGTGDNFDDNAEDFPDDLVEVLPCMSFRWTGTADSNWNNPANWSCNEVPGPTRNAIIPAGTPFHPVLQSGNNGGVKNLNIETNALVTVIDRELSISGNLTSAGGLDADNGRIKFAGSNIQTIPAGTFANELVYDLIIENPSGVISEATINIVNSLNINSGSFETGNAATLLSDETRTAYIDGSGNGSITGTVKMQRYLPSGFGYKYFSSPFSTSLVGDFSPFMNLSNPSTSFPHFFTYNENREDATGEDITGWEAYTNPLSTLTPGIGYAANISAVNGPVTVELEGQVNKGPIALNLQNNDGIYTKGFHLIGNPYPSPIDWNLVNKSGIDDAAYFFTAGTEDRYTGTYTSYINGVSNDGNSSNVIPSMQGFFVKVSTPGTTGIIEFSDAVRITNSSSQPFYQAKRPNVHSKLILSAGYLDAAMQDALVFYTYPGSTFHFESNFDARKLLNTSTEVPSFYTLAPGGEKLSINAVSGFTNNVLVEIPLGFNALKSGKMRVVLKETPATLFSPHIYLKDLKKEILWDLKSDYTFDTQKGEFNDRFRLVLSPDKLNAEDLKLAFKTFNVSTSSGEIIVETRLSDKLEGKLQLTSLLGRALQRKTVSGKEEVRFTNLQTGIYLVTLSSKEGEETRKILVRQ